jgi:hypothetical protein
VLLGVGVRAALKGLIACVDKCNEGWRFAGFDGICRGVLEDLERRSKVWLILERLLVGSRRF